MYTSENYKMLILIFFYSLSFDCVRGQKNGEIIMCKGKKRSEITGCVTNTIPEDLMVEDIPFVCDSFDVRESKTFVWHVKFRRNALKGLLRNVVPFCLNFQP